MCTRCCTTQYNLLKPTGVGWRRVILPHRGKQANSLWPQPCQRGNRLQDCPKGLQPPGHLWMSCLWGRMQWYTRRNSPMNLVLNVFLSKKWKRVLLHTSKRRLAFVLNEEQLTPVGTGSLHPEHHQIGHGQQPQVGRQQEFRQRAFITGGCCAGRGQRWYLPSCCFWMKRYRPHDTRGVT